MRLPEHDFKPSSKNRVILEKGRTAKEKWRDVWMPQIEAEYNQGLNEMGIDSNEINDAGAEHSDFLRYCFSLWRMPEAQRRRALRREGFNDTFSLGHSSLYSRDACQIYDGHEDGYDKRLELVLEDGRADRPKYHQPYLEKSYRAGGNTHTTCFRGHGSYKEISWKQDRGSDYLQSSGEVMHRDVKLAYQGNERPYLISFSCERVLEDSMHGPNRVRVSRKASYYPRQSEYRISTFVEVFLGDSTDQIPNRTLERAEIITPRDRSVNFVERAEPDAGGFFYTHLEWKVEKDGSLKISRLDDRRNQVSYYPGLQSFPQLMVDKLYREAKLSRDYQPSSDLNSYLESVAGTV